MLIILFLPFFAAASDLISGTVIDSVSGKTIPGVKITVIASACSTFTDTLGKFSLTIVTVNVAPEELKISWDKRGFMFSGYPGSVQFQLADLGGKIYRSFSERAGNGLPSGIYFLRVRAANQTGIFKILNLSFGSAAMKISAAACPALAKSAAADHNLIFTKPDYQPASRLVYGSVTDLIQFLTPLRAIGSVKVNLDSAGSVTIKPIFQN
ncbi:MAG TPA: hypothetical protein VMC41_01485 [Candidatus Nanoarchaeia archaeon]|nr:hypothetical protein [Candidatus Nanoarchaeia archaeon]